MTGGGTWKRGGGRAGASPDRSARARLRSRPKLRSPPRFARAGQEEPMPAIRRLVGLVTLVCAFALASRAEAQVSRYPRGPIHSPMTAPIVLRLKKVLAASGSAKDAFVKI